MRWRTAGDLRCTRLAPALALACLAADVPPSAYAQPPDRQAMIRYAAESGEGTWAKATTPQPGLTSRELYTYALALCEANAHPERLARLFEVGAQMQDRDENSLGYGNFRWSWEHGAVLDFNAVEFCMQAGAVIWLKHKDALPPDARAALEPTLTCAIEGCKRHRVPESYTNIALMNAENLILLGEGLGQPEVADEGYARLDRVVLYTYEFGVHEYDSPTYYGTDLDCLVLTQAFCQRERGRQQLEALLELMWTDIALNWFAPAQKLAGARSRDYDYLHGLGYLDVQMWANGWLPGDSQGGTGAVYPALATWQPPERLRELNASRFPRLVRQSWGISANQSRTHYMLPDVTLSTSGATYGTMDLPLTVDLPGPREQVRCYFIPDGRRDPYGKKRIPEGSGPHQKTLHLTPFFSAVQRSVDALALVVYRERDLLATSGTLETHFVMPRDVDAVWLGDRRVEIDPARPIALPVQQGEAVVLRKGAAAVGVRVPWACNLEGAEAPVALVYDGNEYGAIRLTVAHHSFWGVEAPNNNAAAALWVRIGGGLTTDAAFEGWRGEFAKAAAQASADESHIRIDAAGADGPLALAVAAPWAGCSVMEPAPSRAVLELDGEDIGRTLLAQVEPIKSYQAQRESAPPNALPVDKGTYLEAEAGQVMPPMVVADDAEASDGRFVWMPGEPGGKGGGPGSVTWRLHVVREGAYYLWGRVQAPTPDDDSFYLRVLTGSTEPVNMADWHVGTHEKWEWTPVRIDASEGPTAIVLPAGDVDIQLRVREDGTKIDRLFITPDAPEEPQ